MSFRTTGPLYIEKRYRNGNNRFGLLLSNLTGSSHDVTVELFAAPFTAADTPETWTRIVLRTVTVPNNTVANLVLDIPKGYPYYQFFTNSEGEVRPALYLLDNLCDAVQDFPLIPNADWEVIPVAP